MKTKNEVHTFTLVLADINEITEELENSIYGNHCDDALISSRDQIVYLDFDREADNLERAVISAINDVEAVGYTVARIEPSDLVTSTEISRRTGRTRESIRLIIKGERGTGGFPVPKAGVTSKTLVWSWAEVSNWLLKNNKIDDPYLVQQANVIRGVNEALELRKHPFFWENIHEYFNKFDKKPDIRNTIVADSKIQEYNSD